MVTIVVNLNMLLILIQSLIRVIWCLVFLGFILLLLVGLCMGIRSGDEDDVSLGWGDLVDYGGFGLQASFLTTHKVVNQFMQQAVAPTTQYTQT